MTQAHKPNDNTREKVSDFKKFGVTNAEIAAYLEISEDTLVIHYKEELLKSAPDANSAIANGLYRKAINGDIAAQIFWLKTRARWRSEDSKTIVESNEQLKEELRKLRDELDAQNKKDY